MAIQFFCSSCRQPIEIDDEMAGKAVTCPYCRNPVTAPVSSDAGVKSSGPAAEVGANQPGELPVPQVVAPPPRSVLGWVALGLVVGQIICISITSISSRSMAQGLSNPSLTPAEKQQAMREWISERPWLQPLGLLGACVFPLIAAVCAIIFLVKKARPRWPGIVALSLVGAYVLLICLALAVMAMKAGSSSGQ